ncbi:transcriptional repressor [Sinisalibacter aestuarii]|uniref:Fur family transcriptional regulator n=1 Tax=Sinisalibacter aestuarii TaxID=2949426 RepID=A0ABQ5LR76_9RHOB|nr:transcriptional repressor [Sinisalibacter aestuarii]GKY87429.1 Fur family transcriptional regulator [Sinisalibacter aestuarii]
MHAHDPAQAFAPHDHATCAAEALARAEEICAETGARLTPVRRRALEILLETHKAMGAYDVLDRLAEDGFGHQPPVAYRALDFLVDQGLVHRIQRLNAFTACTHPGGHKHAPVFLICEHCHVVAEAPGRSVQDSLERAAGEIGFAIERAHVEALGLCPACRETDA